MRQYPEKILRGCKKPKLCEVGGDKTVITTPTIPCQSRVNVGNGAV